MLVSAPGASFAGSGMQARRGGMLAVRAAVLDTQSLLAPWGGLVCCACGCVCCDGGASCDRVGAGLLTWVLHLKACTRMSCITTRGALTTVLHWGLVQWLSQHADKTDESSWHSSKAALLSSGRNAVQM